MPRSKEEIKVLLLQFLPKGSTLFSVQRDKGEGWKDIDVYHFSPVDGSNRTDAQWLNGFIAGLLGKERNGDSLRLYGTGTDLRADLVQELAAALYGRDDALDHQSL